MKKVVGISLVLLALLAALNVKTVSAAGNNSANGQYGQYGAAPTQDILIDKTVATGEQTKGGVQTFVDNLSPSDPRFAPEDEVTFRLKVKNVQDEVLDDVVITDNLPPSVDFLEGPAAASGKTLTIKVGDLKPNEEKTFTFKTKVRAQAKLPQDKGVFCEINRVKAQAGKVTDEDNAQFCIEKSVPGKVKEVPQAGPSAGLLLLAGQFGLLGTGIFLKKRSS